MRLLDASALVLHASPAAMFGAEAAIAEILGHGVHLVNPGMMSRIRCSRRKPNETNIEFLARIAIINSIAGRLPADEPVIVRHPGVMDGDPVFRGTRVPPGPVFSMLADQSADKIARGAHPSLSPEAIKTALQQACRLLEREAPWVD